MNERRRTLVGEGPGVACLEKSLHLARGVGPVAFVDKDALRIERIGKDVGTA